MEEQKHIRWQKIAMSLGGIALLLIGLVVVAHADVGDKYAELVKAFSALCQASGYILVAAIVGNVGEHWKPVIQKVLSKVGLASTPEEPPK